MKKTNFLYKAILIAGFMSLVFLHSCKKDELDSSDLLVYVTGDYASEQQYGKPVPFLHTPVSVSGDSTIKIAASATRGVAADARSDLHARHLPGRGLQRRQ